MKNILRLTLFGLLLAIVSCNQETYKPVDSEFPLRQAWSFRVDSNITATAGIDDWIAIGTSDNLIAMDATNGMLLWSNEFPVSSGISSLAISDKLIAAASFEKIKGFARSGKELWSIDLLKPNRGSANILSILQNYLFVIRTVDWYLEVYNTDTGKLIWDVNIARGNSSVYFDPNKDLVYVLTPNAIEVHNAKTGSLLQTLPGRFDERIFSNNILYYFSEGDDPTSSYFSAYDFINQGEIWKSSFSGKVHNITISNGMLIASTSTGIVSIDPQKGNQLWQAVSDQDIFAPVVNQGDLFYAKGAISKKLYAFTSKTGNLIGSLQVEKPVTFAQPDEDYRSGILVVQNLLIFTAKNQIFAYGKE